MPSPRMYHASRREPGPPTTSQFSFSAGRVPRRPRALPDDDLDPAVPRFSNLVRRRNEQLSLAASGRLDALRSDAELDESRPDSLGALYRQPIVVVLRADGVGVADDDDLRRRDARDRVEDALDDHFRLRGELVAVQKEVEEERRGPRRLSAERRLEDGPQLRLRRGRRFHRAGL